MDIVAALCDRVTALEGGRVIAAGTTREIFAQPDLLNAHGLSVPPLAAAARKLRLAGWPVPAGIFDADEMVSVLRSSSPKFFAIPTHSEELVETRRNYGVS
jgi:ABC-type glutathione transport system ATPase component